MRNSAARHRFISYAANPPRDQTAQEKDALKERNDIRLLRQSVLHDAVKSVTVWILLAFFFVGLSWGLAHYTVSHRLQFWFTGSVWMMLGFTPIAFSERMLQRTACGLNLRGVSADGPLLLCPGIPQPVEVPLSAVPGAPWFGPARKVRLSVATATGLLFVIMDRQTSPLACAIGGTVLHLLLLIRAAHASIWICDFRMNHTWRKNK
eukprot:TRINITY_DN21561_c0_g1_i1.p1 TRINITY_DN21561_c0_g1~~TRINITY_DN21561_c0_g1_i1.p1  ORF type:complete len:207 (+),score=18.42 TRINITY_DN21561_c0_g1_i1:133-753(+)